MFLSEGTMSFQPMEVTQVMDFDSTTKSTLSWFTPGKMYKLDKSRFIWAWNDRASSKGDGYHDYFLDLTDELAEVTWVMALEGPVYQTKKQETFDVQYFVPVLCGERIRWILSSQIVNTQEIW